MPYHGNDERSAVPFPQLGDEGHASAGEPLAELERRLSGGRRQRKPWGSRRFRVFPSAPTGLINPTLDYDWGPDFNYVDGSGVPSKIPPAIKHVISGKVPRVDADGNELGGVPVVLRDAPLGTYLGWNITAAGFHQGKNCNYAGGMIPFAKTKAERLAKGDPRLSLEERYKTHAGYVEAVKAAAARAVAQGFLLQDDADALVKQAAASNVLNP